MGTKIAEGYFRGLTERGLLVGSCVKDLNCNLKVPIDNIYLYIRMVIMVMDVWKYQCQVKND